MRPVQWRSHLATMTRCTALLATFTLAIAACASDPESVAQERLVGYWSGDWGQMTVEQTGADAVRAVYNHDEGMLEGRWEGGVMKGWWCEEPSRSVPDDAGEVEFRLSERDGELLLDGRWRYGTSGEWREDWDLSASAGEPPTELALRLDESHSSCPGR